MDSSTHYFGHAELSQIYRTLKQLERDGLVTSAHCPQANARSFCVGCAPEVLPDLMKKSLLRKLLFAQPAGKEAILPRLRLNLPQHPQQLKVYRGLEQELQQLAARQTGAFHRRDIVAFYSAFWTDI